MVCRYFFRTGRPDEKIYSFPQNAKELTSRQVEPYIKLFLQIDLAGQRRLGHGLCLKFLPRVRFREKGNLHGNRPPAIDFPLVSFDQFYLNSEQPKYEKKCEKLLA